MLMATRPPKERRATGTPIDRLLVVASSGVSADMTGPLPHHREGGYARRSWGEDTTHALACLRWVGDMGTGPHQRGRLRVSRGGGRRAGWRPLAQRPPR